jgi:hypothetical protein
LIEIGLLVLKIFFYFNGFLFFCYYLPLEKGFPLHLKTLVTSALKGDVCKVGLIGLLVKKKSNKRNLQTDGLTTSDKKSSLELSAPLG